MVTILATELNLVSYSYKKYYVGIQSELLKQEVTKPVPMNKISWRVSILVRVSEREDHEKLKMKTKSKRMSY